MRNVNPHSAMLNVPFPQNSDRKSSPDLLLTARLTGMKNNGLSLNACGIIIYYGVKHKESNVEPGCVEMGMCMRRHNILLDSSRPHSSTICI
jgi:hypothetical protein